jgi:hypothetical protein
VAHVDFWERRASVEKVVEVYPTIRTLSAIRLGLQRLLFALYFEKNVSVNVSNV